MAQQTTETAHEALLRHVELSCAASGVPLTVEDEPTLLELARRFNEG